MLIELLFFSLLGVPLGIVLGLLPGMHINNVIPIMLSLSFLVNNPYYLAILIISTATVQIFTSFIPSIFLGAPDEDTSLSVLPGHKMLMEGRGYEAIKLTIIGGMGAIVVSVLMTLFLGSYFTLLHDFLRPYIAYALIGVTLFMVLSEKSPKKILGAFVVVLLSGLLGIFVLNTGIVSQKNVLFPTLAGLFATSTLLVSINQKTKIPKQKTDSKINLDKSTIIKSIILGALAGMLVGLLPAIGVSQAAIFMQYFGGLGEARSFLMTLSGIGTANEVISLNSLYLISNPRSGSSVAVERLIPNITYNDMLLFIGVILFVSGIAIPIILFIGRLVPNVLSKINYTILSASVLLFITFMVFIITGVYGLLIGITSTAIGVLCFYLDVRRSNCMSVLIIPSILFFLGVNPLILTLLNI